MSPEQTISFLQQLSSKQELSILQYSGSTSSAPHSDFETLLTDLDDIDDDFLSSSSSTMNKSNSMENQWKQPVFPSNQILDEQNSYSSQVEALHYEELLSYPAPPFPSPPKLKLLPVSEIIKEHPGTDVASLWELTIALARDRKMS